MAKNKVRVRYAPSPTGHLHIGNARTALFNYLFARHNKGTFVLRIEDTDTKRNVADGEKSQMENLKWLGIDWDEGPDKPGKYGPYRQSERKDIYQPLIQELLDKGLAYESYMTEEELGELLMSLAYREDASYDGNLQELGYVDFGQPNEISIYPSDFESKEQVLRILDNYNERMEEEGKEDQVITYTDIVGTMTSSVTDIIDIISYVLIAFVAISLVVSSIMIGVITYISVLERKKEIGILRAIGASKRNVSQVFNAETFIIGLAAGLIGIGLTLLILIPGNMLIHYLAGTTDVSAVLPAAPAVVLILLSVLLTLVGGLIPSRKAAKSDPVTALRTE